MKGGAVMKLLAIPMLAAVLGQAGDDPAKILKAVEDKVTKADAVQVALDVKVESTKGDGSIKGTLTVAAGNKARAELAMEFKGKAQKVEMVSDGKMMVEIQDGKAREPREAEKHFQSLMPLVLARSGLGVAFFLLRGPGAEKEDPLDTITVSDAKKLKAEKVDGRDAVVIEYKVNVKGEKVSVTATVWVDVKTNLPLRRVARAEVAGDTFTVTETYSNLRLNPKLAPDFFQLPK
jgi:outer membrane lipoprotein-sorting protein